MESSRRIALCIGCNLYDDDVASDLGSAELDARRMFAALTRPELGGYDPELSQLVLSPTLQELRTALVHTLFGSAGPIETFTFFFAGHGKVNAGSFYMWVKDSKHAAQSVSAFSLSDLFRGLNEAAPAQSNIIIDACESGGLIKDLGTLLNKAGMGDAASSGITLVATAAQDQASGEGTAGGFGTLALLDCIEGRDFVQDRTATLDLVEIGRRVAERFAGTDQSPVVWGLNLLQAPRFCRNPRFRTDPAKPFRDAVTAWRSRKLDKEVYESLWNAYTSTSGSWTPSKFLDQIRPALMHQETPPDLRADLAVRLAASMSERAREAEDAFRATLVSASLGICLLGDLENSNVSEAAESIHRFTLQNLEQAIERLIDAFKRDEFCLLHGSQNSPFSELYFLPLRISDVLGWAAVLAFEDDSGKGKAQFKELLILLSRYYGGSLVALSERQAPALTIALAAAAQLGLSDGGEELVGRLFHSLVTADGKIAPVHLPARDILGFLLRRAANTFEPGTDLVQTPIQLGTVLLRAATRFRLDGIFDESLWKLDGLSLYAYVPESYRDYAAPVITAGANTVWTVGHDLFRVAEVEAGWPSRAPSPKSELESALATYASLLLPNRVAWFHLG